MPGALTILFPGRQALCEGLLRLEVEAPLPDSAVGRMMGDTQGAAEEEEAGAAVGSVHPGHALPEDLRLGDPVPVGMEV